MCVSPMAVRKALLLLTICFGFSTGGIEAGENKQEVAVDWRGFSVLRPPVFEKDGKNLTLTQLIDAGVEVWRKSPPDLPRTPAPAEGWRKVEFDDSSFGLPRNWIFNSDKRMLKSRSTKVPNAYYRARFGIGGPPSLSMLCCRGRFWVKDPSAVKQLSLELEYRGGVAIFLNGVEVKRAHLPAGKLSPETVASRYPPEAHVDSSGKILSKYSRKFQTHFDQRVRKLQMDLSVASLRKGLNVLALQSHRSPLDPIYVKGLAWSPVRPVSVQLISSQPEAFEPRAARTEGVGLWTADVVADLSDGQSLPPIKPGVIKIVAARNGTFSGQVVVRCPKGVLVKKGELSGFACKTGGELPSTIANVRYVLPRNFGCGVSAKKVMHSDRRAMKNKRLEILSKVPFLELPQTEPKREAPNLQPVWLRVTPPADAKPGKYQAELTIHFVGHDAVRVPVELRVCAFKLPDPDAYSSMVDIIQSPESLALQLEVPLYSEPHWKLIEKSWKLLREIGNEVVYIPVITKTHFGNERSMVLWKKKPDGTYSHDFSLVDRYLATVLKSGAKPTVVCLYAWDYYCIGNGKTRSGGKKGPEKASPPLVSVLDSATGKISEMKAPSYEDPEAAAFWKPVAEGFMACARKHGLEMAVMIGISGDLRPTKNGGFKVWNELLPGVPWLSHSHNSFCLKGYGTIVYKISYPQDPNIQRSYGWRDGHRISSNVHRGWRGASATHIHARLMNELVVSGGQKGLGRIRGDLWGGIVERFMYNDYRQLSLDFGTGYEILQPGVDGPVTTISYEMFREGIQETEARVCLERALLDKTMRAKLGEALAEKFQAMLDKRIRYMLWAGFSAHGNSWGEGVVWKKGAADSGKLSNKIGRTRARAQNLCGTLWAGLGVSWYSSTGWQERSTDLFEMAGQVDKVLNAAGD